MMRCKYLCFLLLFAITACNKSENKLDKIDRKSLVERHQIILTEVDSLDALTVGNGDFAFTVDATGLQSFPEYYERGVSLGTLSQWGWHSMPNTGDYKLSEVLEDFETCGDKKISIATQHKTGRAKEVTDWFRANPHRLHLGLVGLEFIKNNGEKATIKDLTNVHQELNMWTGSITSRYEIDNESVEVELYAHQDSDEISFRIISPLVTSQRLKVTIKLPYGKECHVCPGYDFSQKDKHQSKIIHQTEHTALIEHRLDETQYAIGVKWENGQFSESAAHEFELQSDGKSEVFETTVLFSQKTDQVELSTFAATKKNNELAWSKFWKSGGVIDFSECTDSRAFELERRVVLSQYLTKIQCSGSLPPQETGLTFNSWYGKHHLEMHWWHGVHFALWNRIDLLEKSMGWYEKVINEAQKTAQRQGYDGVRWQKMTANTGISSPSSVGEFLIWQQPHPIYFAELFYRQFPNENTLKRFEKTVFETADFMASFAYKGEDDNYHLCHPIIPAQEIFRATETDDPPFEVAYWYFGLTTAQKWRERMNLPLNKKWDDIIQHLTPLHQDGNLYLPAARAFDAYTNVEHRRDHPIVTGALGMLPYSQKIDTIIMANTFDEIMKSWNWQTTWGWDYPMLAMCAARLGKADKAIDALLMDVQKNTYLPNGHNYQDQRLRIYLPGNGGLLTAVAMMAAGWDGSVGENPGFPKNGQWKVKWEGLVRMP